MPLHPLRSILGAALLAACAVPSADAAVALLQPSRRVNANQPFTLTLVISGDAAQRSYAVPAKLRVTASADLQGPVEVILDRHNAGAETLHLRPGQVRTVAYTGTLPEVLRGTVRIDVPDLDAAPVLVTLVRGADAPQIAADGAPTGAARNAAAEATRPGGALGTNPSAPAASATATATPPAPVAVAGSGEASRPPEDTARLTFHEPMFAAVGAHGGLNAKFQLSFKFRIFQPENPASAALLDNVYFGYTQFSLWDVGKESAPFRDTNYRPSVFYYRPDTGIRGGALTRLSFAGGIEHESNGRDGDASRAINTVFVRPTFHFGDLNDYHWKFEPKLYAYLTRTGNTDIAHYRGFGDFRVSYGAPNGWELAATLRKGTRKAYGSVDAQLTYPMSRIFTGTAGYLFIQYFTGYGESLLDYNHKLGSQLRVGYSLSR
ncbi:phospholipase A [Burkholderiaceae bacterium 26]|jgi:outer membrane phospholipase A|uniref:phospholipase A n=1 Tax=Ralstonia sp. TaxID=54061 RepID=UPI0005EB35F9|nr:phospholipase A [Ralstonia sp.]KJK04133.1 phospholipase A [Burkholderiaceae bacterium 26]HWV04638.1 phospholipase A [Ralstonia sp.]